MTLTKDDLIDGFRAAGLEEGDWGLLHSSYKSLGGVEGGAETVIDALLEAVAPTGTMAFPTFNLHSWTEGHYFDIQETPSEMGVITELARRRPDAVRSPHPIYPFAAIGAGADTVRHYTDESAYGKGSVFELLDRVDARILVVGLEPNHSLTMVHYVEELEDAPWRRHKAFSGIYLGSLGFPQLETYSMFVRRRGVRTAINPAAYEMLDEGVITKHRIGEAEVLSVSAQDFVRGMTHYVREEPGKLRELEEGW